MRPEQDVQSTEDTQRETGEDTRLTTEDMADAGRRPEGGDEDTHEMELPADDGDAPIELFPQEQIERFRVEWQEVQTRFVDDPRDAVQSADHLVAEVMRSLASTFADHKHELEGQWREGSQVETEDLRRALRRYRSFFNQLLNA